MLLPSESRRTKNKKAQDRMETFLLKINMQNRLFFIFISSQDFPLTTTQLL